MIGLIDITKKISGIIFSLMQRQRVFLLITFSSVKFFLVTCFFCCFSQCWIAAQVPGDSIPVHVEEKDSSPPQQHHNIYGTFTDSSIFIHASGTPQALKTTAATQKDAAFFYPLVALLLLLGIIKTMYGRYFNSLFRVFFNTSLRQSQLTDQLEQARLPSVIFNIFFVISAGFYVYLIISYFSPGGEAKMLSVLARCLAAVAACYFVKYLSLRFTGWLTNYREEARTYIFIVFLLNKVVGILLLPFTIIILYSSKAMISNAVFISLIMLSLILVVRFFRAWSLLQNRLKLTRFHFFLYVLGLELLPLALIYKGVMLFLGKSS